MKSYNNEYDRGRTVLVNKYIPFGCYDSLDLGCGVGVFSKIMHDRGHRVLGIDYDVKKINVAKENYNNFSQMQFSSSNLKNITNCTGSNKYSFILALEIIEHLEDYKLFLKNISYLLRSSGKLIISTPNYFSVEGVVGTFWAKRNNEKFQAWDSSHIKIFSSFEFVDLIKAHNLDVEKIIGYYYNSSDPLPIIKKHIRLPFSSNSQFPINMFGFNTIIIAKKK